MRIGQRLTYLHPAIIHGNLDDKTQKEQTIENTQLKSQNKQLKEDNTKLANALKDREQQITTYEGVFRRKNGSQISHGALLVKGSS